VIWDFETRGIAKVLGDSTTTTTNSNTGSAAADPAAADPAAVASSRPKQPLPGASDAAAAAGGAEGGAAAVTAVGWSRDGRRLLVGDAAGKVALWDVVAGAKVRTDLGVLGCCRVLLLLWVAVTAVLHVCFRGSGAVEIRRLAAASFFKFPHFTSAFTDTAIIQPSNVNPQPQPRNPPGV